jgi:hypothetical protein
MKMLFVPIIVIILSFTSNLFSQVSQYFTLVNNTGKIIDQVFVAPVTDSEKWGPNLLGSDPLKNEESRIISFDKSKFLSDCVWDIKTIMNNKNSKFWYNLDLCNYNVIKLYLDGDGVSVETEFQ